MKVFVKEECKLMKTIDSVYGRPRRNPNRWMITQCYVQEEKHFDWYWVIVIAAMLYGCLWIVWALCML